MSEPMITMQCPKCGNEMYVLQHTARTHNGIKTITLACEECLHTEDVKVIAKNGDKQ